MDLHRCFLLPTALLCGASSLAFVPGGFMPAIVCARLEASSAINSLGVEPALPDFEPDITAASQEHGVSRDLIRAIIRTESKFDRTAVSSRGACGLMQLMPVTARSLGVVDCFDARENIRAGARHLKALLTRYGGSVPMSVAAYNAGETAVARHRGIPPYPETRAYVRRVTALLASS